MFKGSCSRDELDVLGFFELLFFEFHFVAE